MFIIFTFFSPKLYCELFVVRLLHSFPFSIIDQIQLPLCSTCIFHVFMVWTCQVGFFSVYAWCGSQAGPALLLLS